ncbi:sigma-54 interaction domain-containing protein [Desulfoluna spongiiphila]|uniref:Transcriptional regulator containing GAF, AAA-type ATPase, and DNA-binding Fis domains n=1 Tax=Desulfoluna spongiiphila TaxID=419481 RepID=A0A1G5AEL1_9BACT|nr:sigma 54-interacting transcriptional regulator [Desulfoluna spongiiphila]SCX76333.1 Transcriptional regulator containing GAF, AAA-type ATPase, and DNA-binding Fis domains [Desulfoluna spongiiphila]
MDNRHFIEVTRRICGSLDLDEALYDVFCYLKPRFPLDALLISIYETAPRQARVFAMAEEGGGFIVDEPIVLSEAAWSEINRWLEASCTQTIPWLRNQDHPINQEILHIVRTGTPSIQARRIDEFCSLTCALKVKQAIIGNLTFAAEGAHHYDRTHVDFIRQLNDPFAIALSNARRYMDLVHDHQALQRDARKMVGDTMIGADSGLLSVRRLIEQVAPTNSPVLLLGETGTGKEVVANEIHKFSNRSSGPMIRVNCSAIPENLIDSELFGHEKGAFTGAIGTTHGRFERARQGTLFLDEVGELPLAAQAKLLRVLQSGEFERVGGGCPLQADVRIIAATHRDLPTMVQDGLFRADLWYRLNVFPIVIPPLRSRKEDIPTMVNYFIHQKSTEMNLLRCPAPTPGAVDALLAYHWPGNVRELQNLVERALIISKGDQLEFFDFNPQGMALEPNQCKDESRVATLDEITAVHIRWTLEKTHGRIGGKGGAAELLGLNASTLRSRMKKMGIPYGRRELRIN